MSTDINLFSYIFSVVVGLLLGYVIGFRYQQPRSKVGMIIVVAVGMLSPWIMVGGWALCAAIRGENYGIQIGTLLGPFCAMLIFGYALRAARKKEVVAGA
jgi:hypothetical protein